MSSSFYSQIGIPSANTTAIESNVANSEAAATNSANSATNSAASAAASAASATSANAADVSATQSKNAAEAAQAASAVSATASSNSATASSTSAAQSAASAITANTEATNSALSAAAASTQATNAAASAASAAADLAAIGTSVTDAAASATSASSTLATFQNQYLGAAATAPTQDPDGTALDLGDLWFDTASDTLKVYASGGWVNAGSSVNGTSERQTYTATAGQTTFAVTYDSGFVDCWMNGSKLLVGSDFTATSGTDIVLASGAAAGDIIDIIAFGTFSLSTHYTKTDADARFEPIGGSGYGDSSVDTHLNQSSATSGQYLKWNGSDYAWDTVAAGVGGATGVDFNDSVKVRFGTGSGDLEIYHDGSHSYVDDTGTGRLYLRGNDRVQIQKYTGDDMITAIADGGVKLYYDNSNKLETTATGVTVNGDIANASGNLTLDVVGDIILDADGSNVTIKDGGSTRFDFLLDSTPTIEVAGGSFTLENTTDDSVMYFKGFDSGSGITALTLDMSDAGTAIFNNKVSIGTSSPAYALSVEKDVDTWVSRIYNTGSDANANGVLIRTDATAAHDATALGVFADSGYKMVVKSTGKTGFGTTSPVTNLDVVTESAGTRARIRSNTTSSPSAGIEFCRGTTSTFGGDVYTDFVVENINGGHLAISSAESSSTVERMRISGAGHFLLNTTNDLLYTTNSDEGLAYRAGDQLTISRSAGQPLILNRLSSDGVMFDLRRDGDQKAVIGIQSTDNIYIGGTKASHGGLLFGTNTILPFNADTITGVDNGFDLGQSVNRFDDVYATNGTIQTSDENEKQNIATLTSAEITAATAISKLFKTYKWKDKVTAKGDNARTHTGVIAQQVQTAMSDAGLDASKYAFWCSNTWWETQTEVAAVEAVDEVKDEDGNVTTEAVEAKDAYTRTDTYDTKEEAPSGATERTRLGVRYPELLAFIGAATEQRLTNIETRLEALEAN